MNTQEQNLDLDLARKADASLRKRGTHLNHVMSMIVGEPDILSTIIDRSDLEFANASDAIKYLHSLV